MKFFSYASDVSGRNREMAVIQYKQVNILQLNQKKNVKHTYIDW